MQLGKAIGSLGFALAVVLFSTSAKAGLIDFTFTGTGTGGSSAIRQFFGRRRRYPARVFRDGRHLPQPLADDYRHPRRRPDVRRFRRQRSAVHLVLRRRKQRGVYRSVRIEELWSAGRKPLRSRPALAALPLVVHFPNRPHATTALPAIPSSGPWPLRFPNPATAILFASGLVLGACLLRRKILAH